MEDMIIIYIIIIGAYLVASIYCAYLMSGTAVMKGYDSEKMHLWAWCFWLGIFGYLYVLSLPDKVLQSQNQQIIELLKNQSVNKSVDEELPEI